MLILSVLTKMLLSTKWVVWTIVRFIPSASPPWLIRISVRHPRAEGDDNVTFAIP